MDDFKKSYLTHEAAKHLKIGESTLRKWCLELEKNGYKFTRGSMDSRVFTEQDMAALNYFRQLFKANRYKQDQAAKLVIEKFFEKGENESTSLVPMDDIRSIENMLQKVLEQNQMLLKRLDGIDKRIIEIINANKK